MSAISFMRQYNTLMEDFLKTKEGLEYLLWASPSDMRVETAIAKALKDFEEEYNDYLKEQEIYAEWH